jgi:hypothetical protein
MATDEEF